MRAVNRKGRPLNTQKQNSIKDLCQAYTREKQFWLHYFQPFKSQGHLARPRLLRNEIIQQNYKSSYGLQARHWKLALDEAAEIWDRYWQATFVKVRSKISLLPEEDARHYAYWLLKGYSQFAALMQKQCPTPSFSIEASLQKRTAAFIRRLVKKYRGKAPSIKKGRTIRFDANCYDCFEHNGQQYARLMSLVPGKRIVVPLLGNTPISGTIILVLTDESIELHISQEIKSKYLSSNTIEAVDFGYTEVMTDTQGIRYGTQFGEKLTKISEDRNRKMQRRHKLHALAKKNPRIRKYNLGKKKHYAAQKRAKATLRKEINTGINQLIRTKKPAILITENLRHTFSYNKSKKINRKLTNWVRGELQDRVSFKALAEGFRHEQVNPAYGSQSCPTCEFVDQRNRTGDSFRCLHCGHEDQADRIAAVNYARRYGDSEIGQYTPYSQVKTILLSRFHRRLETEDSVLFRAGL